MEYSVHEVYAILGVPSIEETIRWYETVLGWKGHMDIFDDEGNCLFGSVMHENSKSKFLGFNLSRLNNHSSFETCESNFTALIYVDNVDAVYARVIEKGATPEREPQDYVWGERNFPLRDINGYRLVITQEIEQVDLEEIRKRFKEQNDQE